MNARMSIASFTCTCLFFACCVMRLAHNLLRSIESSGVQYALFHDHVCGVHVKTLFASTFLSAFIVGSSTQYEV